MPFMSFYDPESDLMFVEEMLPDIESFIAEKKKKVDDNFNDWKSENTNEEDINPDWYSFMEDGFVDQMYMADIMEENILNGIALTLGTIFERHVSAVIRQLGKKIDGFVMNERHTYSMKEFKGVLNKSGFINAHHFSSELQNQFKIYMEIRNCIAHKEGYYYEANKEIRDYLLNNESLFKLDKGPEKFSVKDTYIQQVIGDIRKLFKLILYDDKRNPVSPF